MTQNQISSNDQTGNVAKPLLSERFFIRFIFSAVFNEKNFKFFNYDS
jgi:hypothetical protein